MFSPGSYGASLSREDFDAMSAVGRYLHHADMSGEQWPGVERIAQDLGLDTATVERGIGVLVFLDRIHLLPDVGAYISAKNLDKRGGTV